MHIVILFKTDLQAEELAYNWVPDPIGSRQKVIDSMQKVLGFEIKTHKFSYEEVDSLMYFTIEEVENPRSITISYEGTEKDLELIKEICKALNVKIYDAESGEFINC